MSNAIPPILVQIAADVSQLKAGLAQAESSIKGMNSTVATANTGMQNMIGTAKRMASTLGVAFAATQVVQFGKDVVMSASSMNESISKVNVVFGEGANAVLKFGETAATSMGLSNQQAIEAAGTYGNLFQAFGIGQGKAQEMSTSLVQLAADLGSFNNTSVDEAINALRSGLSGETEPLKRFGVALNDVTLKNKALEMGFGNIKGVMDPAIKAQVTYALVMEQTKLAQGDYARTASGTANTMKTLTAQFADAKVAIGDLVLPAFNALLKVTGAIIPVIKSFAKYFKDNADALKLFAIILATVTAGFYAYKAAVVITSTVTAVYTAVTKAMAAGHSLAAIATLNLRGAMMMLNMAIKANPIGFLITALIALGAAIVWAWNKFDWFRAGMIKAVQIILTGLSKLLSAIGSVAGGLGKLPGMGKFKDMGDSIKQAADNVLTFSKNLSDLKTKNAGYGEGAFTYGSGSTTPTTESTKPSAAAIAAAQKAAKEQQKLQEQATKDLKTLQDKLAEIQANYDEDVTNAHKRELDARLSAQKQFNDRMRDLNEAFAEKQADIEANHTKRLTKIENDYAESVIKIKSDFADKMQQISEDNDKAISNITASHYQKIADIQASYAEKLQGIVDKSIARLTDAFANATQTDVGKMFTDMEKAGDVSGEALVAKMKERLTSIKKLAENASALAGAGFSQTFIEQVMALGPEAGNKMSEALLKGSPQSTKEMQDLFGQLEDVSNTGVTALAQSMSSGGKLATRALMEEYKKTQKDLARALEQENMLYAMALADQAAKFKEAMDKVNAELAKALADAKAKLDAQITDEHDAYTETLTNAQTDYDKAVADAAKTRDEAFASAQEQLVEDIAKAEKTMADALDKLQKVFKEKLDPVKTLVKGIGSEIAGLGGQIEALLARLANAKSAYEKNAAANAASILGGSATPKSPEEAMNSNTNNINLNIKADTNATPENIANAALNAIRFGLPLGAK